MCRPRNWSSAARAAAPVVRSSLIPPETVCMFIRKLAYHAGGAFAALLLSLGGATAASAQNSTGTIRGTVTGTNGAPVADAQIQVRNAETGAQRGTISRADGFYVLAGLVPAPYAMTVRRIVATPHTRTLVR